MYLVANSSMDFQEHAFISKNMFHNSNLLKIIQRSINLLFGFIVVVLNIIEIRMISKVKRKKELFEILLVSLCLSDLSFGLSISIFHGLNFIRKYTNYCKIIVSIIDVLCTLRMLFILISILHLTWIAFVRYIAVKFPFKLRDISKRSNVFFVIFGIWVISVGFSLSVCFTEFFTKTKENNFKDNFVNASHVLYSDIQINATFPDKVSIFLNKNYATLDNNSTIYAEKNSPFYNELYLKRIKKKHHNNIQFVLSCVIIFADIFLSCVMEISFGYCVKKNTRWIFEFRTLIIYQKLVS